MLPFSCTQVHTAAEVLAKGLGAAYGRKQETAYGYRRALLAADSSSAASAASTADAYNRLSSSTTGLNALVSMGTAVGTVKVAGSPSICLAVARDDVTVGDLDGISISLNCGQQGSVSSATKRKLLQGAAAANATLTMPANFSASCAADPTCSQGGIADVQSAYTEPSLAAAIMAQVQNWPASSLLGTLAANNTQLVYVSGVDVAVEGLLTGKNYNGEGGLGSK